MGDMNEGKGNVCMPGGSCDKGGCGSCGSGGSCGCGMGGSMGHGMMWKRHHGKGPFFMLALLALAVWLGFKARNENRMFDYIGVPLERDVISVSGEGKAVGIPDLASIDLGTTIEKKTVAEAQAENTRVMNDVNAKLKDAGVKAEDIQTTSYNVNPNYDWNNGKQSLRSYSVSQNVHVKIRDLAKVGDIIGMAGTLGANQIGGISFTVDKPEALQAEARSKAIADAKAKAAAIASAAGISLDKIVSFSEGGSSPVPPMYYAKDMMGVGGAEAVRAPTVQAGSSEYVSDVTITYQIR